MTRVLTLVCLAAAVAAWQEPAPVFRAGSHAVNVIVAVFDGDRVVTGLTASQFELRDNGVRQTVEVVDFNALPVDLRLVFDTSGSISDEEFDEYVRAMRRVAAALEPRDRCDILTFNARIAEAAALQQPPVTINPVRGGPDGTAFFDAVSLALVTVPTPDRRQVTVVLSDAVDNVSFFDEATLFDAAQRSDAVVYALIPGDPKRGRSVSVSRMQALALKTGGRLMQVYERSVASTVIDAIREFRQSYVLRYTVTGVPIEGWHKLEVKVPHMFYRVRTKAGYFGR